ncbi:MAG: nicotinate-nucleotide adenylyltransferase [Gammaproteobacteria bacterium]|nr:MAG: nicotinate-nucleotide adenylyltransferase [Gammaproteobacteria bacterium]
MSEPPVRLLYGGTFDPVHHAHLRNALEARDWLARLAGVHASEVPLYLIPCARPGHRDAPGASAEQRVEMLRLALEGLPAAHVDTRELTRSGASWTVDTLLSWREDIGRDAPLVLLMGRDAFRGLASWHRWLEIVQLAHIMIMNRPFEDTPFSGQVATLLSEHQTDQPHDLLSAPAGRIIERTFRLLDISASEIRASVQSGVSVRYLVPEKVQAYIEYHALYRD